ncbi:hypothetical protein ACLESD_22785, partial [Pyxidicoccus sp. 3LFB2]
MSTLLFPSEEALQLALTSGLVPAEVQASPARYRRTAEGALLVTPDVALSKAALKELASLGVRAEGKLAGVTSPVLCWAELLRSRRIPVDAAPGGPVLFLPAEAHALLPLAGEMLRLGCDRQEVCFAGGGKEAGHRALLRAVASA